ncbi:MAG: ribonuclease HII [Clostridia bacterium]|nr:ribonuclease HII [Clostridia bacterium]MBR0406951.1 ribonuclease HII [Clostridia bacterium]
MSEQEEKRRERLNTLIRTDLPLWAAGVRFAGMDEAGRGPLVGNVVAACVVMPKEPLLLWVDDSKKLSESRREKVYEQIMETALFVGVGQASAAEIDEYNILNATKMAMRRAAANAPADLFLIDALQGLGLPGEERGIIHGDALCYSIAAASIIAKVTRDRQMEELDRLYPGYGFAKHKGYGTAQHIAALKDLGPCPEHRRSFIGHFVSV